MKALVIHCRRKLDQEVEEEILPFSRFNVRVDTGRLKQSIAADPSQHNPRYRTDDGGRINAVVATVTFGGTSHFPSARIDSRGLRLVDYAADLDAATANLSSDIFAALPLLYRLP
jgi:hypothetical protein